MNNEEFRKKFFSQQTKKNINAISTSLVYLSNKFENNSNLGAENTKNKQSKMPIKQFLNFLDNAVCPEELS